MIELLENRNLRTAINITGTSGDDTIDLTLSGNYVTATVNGTQTQYSSVTSISISGAAGNDHISVAVGITRNATLSGGDGADSIYGGGGNDFISGGAGNDYLYGNDGNDTVDGNGGGNYVYGGRGADYIDLDSDNTSQNYLYQNNSSNDDDGSVDNLYPVIGQNWSDGCILLPNDIRH